MKKFVICTDYKAQKGKGLEYTMIEAEDAIEAMSIADSRWTDDIYMMQIMKQDGKTVRQVKGRNGFSTTDFTAVLARRSFGWHNNDAEHSEAPHRARWFVNRFFDYIETV